MRPLGHHVHPNRCWSQAVSAVDAVLFLPNSHTYLCRHFSIDISLLMINEIVARLGCLSQFFDSQFCCRLSSPPPIDLSGIPAVLNLYIASCSFSCCPIIFSFFFLSFSPIPDSSYPSMDPLYCLGPKGSNATDWNCLVKMGTSYAIPFFAHSGPNKQYPQRCDCSTTVGSQAGTFDCFYGDNWAVCVCVCVCVCMCVCVCLPDCADYIGASEFLRLHSILKFL